VLVVRTFTVSRPTKIRLGALFVTMVEDTEIGVTLSACAVVVV